MLILGAVLEVQQYVVVFSLPFNMKGTLAISDVSDHLTRLAESEAQRLDPVQEGDGEVSIEGPSPPSTVTRNLKLFLCRILWSL